MSGNFAPLPVANGQLPNSQAAILTCPAGMNYYVKQLYLFNNNAATQTIFLYLVPNGGTQTTWHRIVLAQNESAHVLEDAESVTLTPGDAIQAVTTTAAAVDFTFTGVQET
ncbi:MAG TPA: hypothetical protein VLH80_07475 [Nitrospiraceae bacterium]|nr:hypothetical protein [Nitrospiraceae bacterium]